MDVLAVTSVIVAGVAAASTGINAFYNTRRTAKTAKEGRAEREQRAADGYLKVLSLAEQEAQWLDSLVYNSAWTGRSWSTASSPSCRCRSRQRPIEQRLLR